MKKLLKRPESLLIAMGLVFLACAVLAGSFYHTAPEGSRVIYVSDSDKAALLNNGEAESVVINLNTATAQELSTLDGIDTVIAAAIIDYRTENGGFKSVDELKNIKGIGDVKFRKISPYVRVE